MHDQYEQYEQVPVALDLQQVADALQVGAGKIRDEIKTGKLRAFRIGCKTRVRRDELDAYMRRMEDDNSKVLAWLQRSA